ncbi:MAG: cytochrome c [Fimbriimonadaceae bacterium]|nr:cytochrome c [Fimbriimonadaceae bacterium]
MIQRYLPLVVLAIMLGGCHTDMWRQPKGEPLGESSFFSDGQMSRPLLAGTIARGKIRQDDAFFTGRKNGKWVTELPIPVTKQVLLRGKERYDAYCTPCHGRLGDGNGMIANRGFTLKRPVGNYHTDRLRKLPVGHFYDVITNGYGTMYSYASRVEPADRWAIVAYIRALQLSQYAPVSDADPVALEESLNPKPKDAHGGDSHGGDSHSGGTHGSEPGAETKAGGEDHTGHNHAPGESH